MKRQAIQWIVVSAILLGGCGKLYSHDETKPQKDKPRSEAVTTNQDPGPNLDGVVEVSFKIDNLGKVQILNINSTSPQLSDYVIKKLSRIQLEEGNTQIGKIIKYRFVFKKQA